MNSSLEKEKSTLMRPVRNLKSSMACTRQTRERTDAEARRMLAGALLDSYFDVSTDFSRALMRAASRFHYALSRFTSRIAHRRRIFNRKSGSPRTRRIDTAVRVLRYDRRMVGKRSGRGDL